MNEKTAKLIREYARVSHKDPRALKREWGSTPRPEREGLRRRMRHEIAVAGSSGAEGEKGEGD